MLLICIGYSILVSLRFNLSLAILAMADTENLEQMSENNENTCRVTSNMNLGNHTTIEMVSEKEIKLDWNTDDQGKVLASFFYGYISTQIIGGVYADRFSPKFTFGFGVSGYDLK